MVGGVVDVFGVDGGKINSTFSPVCPAAPAGVLVSQVLAGRAASSRTRESDRQPA